jgi:hypothetical protein
LLDCEVLPRQGEQAIRKTEKIFVILSNVPRVTHFASGVSLSRNRGVASAILRIAEIDFDKRKFWRLSGAAI